MNFQPPDHEDPRDDEQRLRDTIGQALADYLGEHADEGVCRFDPFNSHEIDALADVVMGVLPASAAPGAPQQEASGDGKRWAAYVANMIETYLQFDQPKRNPSDQRIAAIAGIIERRMMFLTRAAATAPAGGVTDEAINALSEKDEFWKLKPGFEYERRYELDAVAFGRAVLALTTAARAAEPARLDLSGLQRYRLSKQWHTMNRDPEGPYVQWDDVVALAAAPTPPTGTSPDMQLAGKTPAQWPDGSDYRGGD